MSENPSENRTFERFAVEFEIEVSVLDGEDVVASETGVLSNVSGGGICFSSNRPELYSVGKRVIVTIRLPGTDAIEAAMTGRGTVIWVGAEDSDARRARVGIMTDTPLSFDRNTRHEPPAEPS
ncbi:MAG: PilZ domain-containing protein [Mariprofundaceae bacterium]|nr:PilZ domain-containing protein [Mariprofundaceae bacterium]